VIFVINIFYVLNEVKPRVESGPIAEWTPQKLRTQMIKGYAFTGQLTHLSLAVPGDQVIEEIYRYIEVIDEKSDRKWAALMVAKMRLIINHIIKEMQKLQSK
jgi:hypothetical protein